MSAENKIMSTTKIPRDPPFTDATGSPIYQSTDNQCHRPIDPLVHRPIGVSFKKTREKTVTDWATATQA